MDSHTKMVFKVERERKALNRLDTELTRFARIIGDRDRVRDIILNSELFDIHTEVCPVTRGFDYCECKDAT